MHNDDSMKVKIRQAAVVGTLLGILTISFLPLHYKYLIHSKGWLHP